MDELPGALAPVGFFDSIGFAEKVDENTMKRYREAKLIHGRVVMLATLGFLVGDKVEGISFLFHESIKGPGITHILQAPPPFWDLLLRSIGATEQFRAEKGWVDPSEVPVDQPGILKADYTPDDLRFDPLGLKSEDAEEFIIMQTKELQNGRLAILSAAGFLAQEAVDGQGIIEHLQTM